MHQLRFFSVILLVFFTMLLASFVHAEEFVSPESAASSYKVLVPYIHPGTIKSLLMRQNLNQSMTRSEKSS